MLFTDTAVMIGLVYNLLPFMVLPLLTNIERLDNRLIDAARDLGANRIHHFPQNYFAVDVARYFVGMHFGIFACHDDFLYS